MDVEGLRRFAANRANQAAVVNLSSNQLKQLPDEAFQMFSHLRQLVLHDNILMEIPRGIEQLQQLELLDLRMNKLALIPAELCNLGNLQTLLLGSNNLEVGLHVIRKLRHHLANDIVQALPRQLGQLEIHCA